MEYRLRKCQAACLGVCSLALVANTAVAMVRGFNVRRSDMLVQHAAATKKRVQEKNRSYRSRLVESSYNVQCQPGTGTTFKGEGGMRHRETERSKIPMAGWVATSERGTDYQD